MLLKLFRKLLGLKPRRISAFVLAYDGQGNVCAVTARPKKIAKGRPVVGLPGGKVDYGESPAQAAMRECLEEGWDLPGQSLDNLTYIYKKSLGNKEIHWFLWNGESPTMLTSYKESDEIFPVTIHPEALSRLGYGNDAAIVLADGIKPHTGSKVARC